jgi:hypothetical protein
MIDHLVQFAVASKPSTNVLEHQTSIKQMKLTFVTSLCRHVFNKLVIPDYWMLIQSLCVVLTNGAAVLRSLV